jgi:hypothetical protein
MSKPAGREQAPTQTPELESPANALHSAVRALGTPVEARATARLYLALLDLEKARLTSLVQRSRAVLTQSKVVSPTAKEPSRKLTDKELIRKMNEIFGLPPDYDPGKPFATQHNQ